MNTKVFLALPLGIDGRKDALTCLLFITGLSLVREFKKDREVYACSRKGYHMVPYKSLDESKIIAAMLHDVFTSCGTVFNSAARRNTLGKVLQRTASEGLGFLTKTLPRLGKAFDKALTGTVHLNAIE